MAALADNWWDVSGDQFTQAMQGLAPAQMQSMNLYGQPSSAVPTFDWMSPSSWSFKGFNDWGKESGMFGGKAPDGSVSNGWGGMAVNALSGALSLYGGMQDRNLKEKMLNQGWQQFRDQFNAQAGYNNSRLEAQNNRRIAEGMVPTTSTADYLAKYGVKKV